jgi:predicted MPP superfamily phosphohydrolase
MKWPALQLIGWTAVLLTVVTICAPLRIVASGPATGFIALILWVLTCLAGIYAAHKIHNKTLTISSPKIQSPHRFVHISDIHAGSRSTAFVRKCITQALSHNPDAVLITGDLLDSSAVDEKFLTPLVDMHCPSWMCLGNHERYVDLDKAISSIENNKTVVLRNATDKHKEVRLIGIDDADDPQQVAMVLPGIPLNKTEFNILLYHKPDGWKAACDHGVDLMLSGHTHAGQVWPFGLLVKRQFPQMVGHFVKDNQHLYVSPGTGTWGPILRFLTRCEMTVIELQSSDSGS